MIFYGFLGSFYFLFLFQILFFLALAKWKIIEWQCLPLGSHYGHISDMDNDRNAAHTHTRRSQLSCASSPVPAPVPAPAPALVSNPAFQWFYYESHAKLQRFLLRLECLNAFDTRSPAPASATRRPLNFPNHFCWHVLLRVFVTIENQSKY